MTQSTGVDPQTLHPACYQDLLDGRPLYQRMPDGSFVEIVPGRAIPCQTVVGESYLLGWRWKDRELGGSQGHLFVRRFESATQYRLQTTSEPRLFTPRGPLRYHVSPRTVRDQIAREGLRTRADRTGLGAIFLASLKPVDTSVDILSALGLRPPLAREGRRFLRVAAQVPALRVLAGRSHVAPFGA